MHDEGTDSSVKIFANIFISFIGAGILGLPYAFKEAGVIEGIVVMSAVGFVSVKAMLLLIDCKDLMLSNPSSLNGHVERGLKKEKVPDPHSDGQHLDYGDIGKAAMGPIGKAVVDITIVVSQIGFCCAYLIFISENLHSIYPRFSSTVYLFTLLVPLAFLSNLRSLNHLAPFSLVADFANVFAYGIVFYFDMEHHHLIHYHIKNFSLGGLPFYLGVAIYCYEGAGLILSLEASVAKEVRSSFRRIFMLALTSCTLLYCAFGVSGYLSFGPETQSIITLNLPAGVFPFVVKGCLCFSLYFTYPVMMFPVSKILERMFCSAPDNGNYIIGTALRIGLVILSGLIVVVIPNFSTLMALIGSSCCTLLAFILPGIFHYVLFRDKLTKWGMALDIFLILLGIIGTVIGLKDAFGRLMDSSVSTSSIPPSLITPTNSTLS